VGLGCEFVEFPFMHGVMLSLRCAFLVLGGFFMQTNALSTKPVWTLQGL